MGSEERELICDFKQQRIAKPSITKTILVFPEPKKTEKTATSPRQHPNVTLTPRQAQELAESSQATRNKPISDNKELTRKIKHI